MTNSEKTPTPENNTIDNYGAIASLSAGSFLSGSVADWATVINKVIENDEIKDKSAVLKELRQIAVPGRWIYRILVSFLGLCAISTVLGIVVLGYIHVGESFEVPDGLIALGSSAIGALAGMLVSRNDA
ncbi:MAG: hypothetical protein KZQ82_06450 [Candidatus Thiodiazotropha sp. (ex Lucinoma annulata)]|nr:hypothetical protein [Candidatus Thiodiazotropha sp. (ex Lucinoma annulata)]